MANPDSGEVTLATLHADLTAGFGEMRAGFGELREEMRAGFGDLKTTLVRGFAGLPTREWSEEMIRLLREGNRLQETRFTQLDATLREQHLETQQTLHALAEGQRTLVEEHRLLSGEVRGLGARIDALLRRRGDGGPAPA
jgi:hypothetical protein